MIIKGAFKRKLFFNDYIRKNVKKPKNAQAGMVVYNNFNTINVSPKNNLVNDIKKVEN